MAMELKQEHLLYAGGAAAAVLAVVALSRKTGGGGGEGPVFAITGPSEATTRELLRAQVDLADIFTRADTERFRIASEQYVETYRIGAGERVAIQDIESRSKLAKILIEPELILARAQAEAKNRTGIIDFLKGIFDIFHF